MTVQSILRAAVLPTVAASILAAAPAQGATILMTAGSLAPTGQTFNRPDANGSATPTTLSSVGTAVRYASNNFFVDVSGSYDFLLTTTTSTFNTFLILYAGTADPFSPTAPLANVVVANDDFGGQAASAFTRALTAGTSYTAVIAGFDNADFGNYMLTVTNSAATGAVPEPATWGLMLLGFGAVGAGARYRRRATAVRFA